MLTKITQCNKFEWFKKSKPNAEEIFRKHMIRLQELNP